MKHILCIGALIEHHFYYIDLILRWIYTQCLKNESYLTSAFVTNPIYRVEQYILRKRFLVQLWCNCTRVWPSMKCISNVIKVLASFESQCFSQFAPHLDNMWTCYKPLYSARFSTFTKIFLCFYSKYIDITSIS